MDRMHGQNNWVNCTDEHGKLDKMQKNQYFFAADGFWLGAGSAGL